MFYVYFLHSTTSNLYYVGYTDNYKRGLLEHNHSTFTGFTSKHRPWVMKAVYECGNDESCAVRIERFIKKQKSRKLIEKLVDGGSFTGILAQLEPEWAA